jgi:flagellin-specific chaperone FliS
MYRLYQSAFNELQYWNYNDLTIISLEKVKLILSEMKIKYDDINDRKILCAKAQLILFSLYETLSTENNNELSLSLRRIYKIIVIDINKINNKYDIDDIINKIDDLLRIIEKMNSSRNRNDHELNKGQISVCREI